MVLSGGGSGDPTVSPRTVYRRTIRSSDPERTLRSSVSFNPGIDQAIIFNIGGIPDFQVLHRLLAQGHRSRIFVAMRFGAVGRQRDAGIDPKLTEEMGNIVRQMLLPQNAKRLSRTEHVADLEPGVLIAHVPDILHRLECLFAHL